MPKPDYKERSIPFSEDRKTGVLIQPQFHRALYYVNNIRVDELYTSDNKELDKWVAAKRKVYEKEKAQVSAPV